MTFWLMQIGTGIDRRAVLRDHFNKPSGDAETWSGMLVMLVLLGVVAGILLAISRFQQRRGRPRHASNPKKLFREVLKSLSITTGQRALLIRMARDLAPRSPVSMLLSPAVFARCCERWCRLAHCQLEDNRRDFDAIGEALFEPSPVPAGRPT